MRDRFLNSSKKSRFANAAPSVLLSIAYPCGLGISADVRGLGAVHSRIEGIANVINPIDLPLQIRRGVAFARQILNSSQKSRSANAAPFVLLPIAYPCGLGIGADVRGLRAVHSRIEGIANVINPIDLPQQIRRGVVFARSLFKLITEISIRKCCALCAFIDNLSLRFGDLGRMSEV